MPRLLPSSAEGSPRGGKAERPGARRRLDPRRLLPRLSIGLARRPGLHALLPAVATLLPGALVAGLLGAEPLPFTAPVVCAAALLFGARNTAPAVGVAMLAEVLHVLRASAEPAWGTLVPPMALALLYPALHLLLREWNGLLLRGTRVHARWAAWKDSVVVRRKQESFLDGLEAFVWEMDADTGLATYVSAFVETVLGYPRRRWLAEPGFHLRIVHPEDREAVRAAFAEVLRTHRTRHLEYRLVGEDGFPVCFRDSIMAVTTESGATRLRGTGIDITARKQAEAGLRLEKERYRDLFDGVPVGLYRTTPHGDFLVANTALVQMMGYPDHESLYQRNESELYADPADRWRWQRAMVHSGGVRNFELPCRRRDGSLIWVRNTAKAVHTENGEVAYYEGVLEDITERRRAENAERQAEEKFRGLVEQSLVGIFMVQGPRIVYANPKMSEIFGHGGAELLALPSFFELVAPENHEPVQRYLAACLENGSGDALSFRGVTSDGTVIEAEVHCTVAEYDGTPAVLGTLLDITARKHAENQLFRAAFHDGLTGLPNRLLFMEALEKALHRQRRGNRFAVLFLDLNRFKVVNDSLGHPVGDELLRGVSQRLSLCLRPGDTVARFGGDEFALLLENLESEMDATRVAERIQETVAAPLKVNGHELYTGASIGIAFSSSEYDEPEQVLRDADMAMYRAKASGTSCVEIFDREMHSAAVSRLQLETDLQRAVERQEFEVYYQPIVALPTGRLTGFEALVRWKHPESGLVSPAAFIPVAEELGLIVPMGKQILRAACLQLAEWQARFPQTPPLSVSVNLSARQFRHSPLLDDVEEILAETGLAPQSLKLEITESMIMDNHEGAASILARLRERGVKTLLDDFGTGYSSLGYLHQLPIDTLKIDRSFMLHTDTNGNGSHLIRTIMNLAHNLGMDVVAEGVETEEQLRLLKQLRCEFAQGYLFSRALPAEELGDILARPEFKLPASASRPLTLQRTA